MAKKKSHEEEIRRGTEQLRQSGLKLDELSSALVPSLEEQWGRGRETDLAIVFSLGKIADSAAAEALLRIEKGIEDKDLKKEIRRSLFKLSQKGLTIPADKRVEEKSPTSILSRSPEIEAYMSPVDGAGGRLVWIIKPQAGHGLQTIQGMVNDREGLQRIGGTQIRRKELRNMAQEIKKQHGITMISVPWEYADMMLYEGFEKAKSRGRSGLQNFHQLRSIVNTGKPKAQDHPVYQRLHSKDVREGAWRELSRRLLDEPELRFWILDPDWAEPFLAQLQEAQSSRLVLNPMQKEERIAGIVRDAVKTLCAGETEKIMQRRLEDMAFYFVDTGRAQLGRLALAVALQIKDGDPGPLDIAFLTGLVQKSFAFYLSEQKSKAEEEPSFIVKP
ncbi:MAG TPA: hypothetical protein VN966_00695 [Candidatus Bathyarchaeia archaeon]|nr:hypothetical protein [Candidatus Bathyarchaeia archaeon]